MRRLQICVVLSALLVASGCGGGSPPVAGSPAVILDSARVSGAIAASMLSVRGVHSSVSCPRRVPQRKGLTFTCVAVTGQGRRRVRTRFRVVQQDSSGDVSYTSVK